MLKLTEDIEVTNHILSPEWIATETEELVLGTIKQESGILGHVSSLNDFFQMVLS